MATYTPNLNLKKPAGTDYVRVADFNENADTLDASIGDLGQLQTAQKTNLVEAVNEAAQSGGSNAPFIDETTLHWMAWDIATAQYVDTGIQANGLAAGFGEPSASVTTLPAGEDAEVEITPSGPGIAKVFDFTFSIPRGERGLTGAAGHGLDILGTYATLPDLQATVPATEQGWMFNIGTEAPYHIYMWDADLSTWIDQGGLQGPAGRGITSIVRTSGTGLPGTVDIYTITYSDETTSEIHIYNGADGQDGAPGPNEITAATATSFAGLLKGNGATVGVATAGTDYAKAPVAQTVTLFAANWIVEGAGYHQTVDLVGMRSTLTIIISPAPGDFYDYVAANIHCAIQSFDSLSFNAMQLPTEDMTVNILIVG